MASLWLSFLPCRWLKSVMVSQYTGVCVCAPCVRLDFARAGTSSPHLSSHMACQRLFGPTILLHSRLSVCLSSDALIIPFLSVWAFPSFVYPLLRWWPLGLLCHVFHKSYTPGLSKLPQTRWVASVPVISRTARGPDRCRSWRRCQAQSSLLPHPSGGQIYERHPNQHPGFWRHSWHANRLYIELLSCFCATCLRCNARQEARATRLHATLPRVSQVNNIIRMFPPYTARDECWQRLEIWWCQRSLQALSSVFSPCSLDIFLGKQLSCFLCVASMN